MPRRLAQQRMTLSDLECLKSPSSALRAISAVAELLIRFVVMLKLGIFTQLYSDCSS